MTLNAEFRRWLELRFRGNVRFDEPMWRHTSLRVGGLSDAFVTPDTPDALSRLISRCRRENIPFIVIGDGTNLLVKDGGIRGIVIAATKLRSDFRMSQEDDTTVRVTAAAGSRLHRLCRFAIRNGLGGMNFAVGIPGTVGGAIRMNAGTAHGCMGDVLDSVKMLTDSGKILSCSRTEFDFCYRKMDLKAGGINQRPHDMIILEGSFRLSRDDPQKLAAEADERMKTRKARQPWTSQSAGCFFRNPISGASAGALIDRAGLKGFEVGTARVSDRHANFIISMAPPASGGSAADILALMTVIQDRVRTLYNVELEPEVKIVGV